MDDYILVGFADQQFALQDYLTLQRAHKFTEQDHRTGMAEVYIERNDQARSGYGGIEFFELLPDRVRIRFNDRGSQMMNGITQMEITFALNSTQLEALRAGLRACFTGFSYYSA